MEIYIIHSNRHSEISVHCTFVISLMKFPLWSTKRFNCKTKKESIFEISWSKDAVKTKHCFPDLTTMFCKQPKSWDRSRAALLDLSIDIVLTKDDTNGQRVSAYKEKLVHNSTKAEALEGSLMVTGIPLI